MFLKILIYNIRDRGSDLYVGIDMGEKLLPIQMVWEVLGKERAKAITNYTKLKLYYSHT